MKQDIRRAVLTFVLALNPALCAAQSAGLWVTAYYTGWNQGYLPPRSLDYGAVEYLVHFSVMPRADGTLDAAANGLTPANVTAAVSAAHAAGRKILFTVGGWYCRPQFEGAMGAAHRDAFIANIVSFLQSNRYDGVDLDMEDMTPADQGDYVAFVKALRARLDGLSPRPLLTAAALWQPQIFAQAAAQLDQVNVMTYSLSGAYPGWMVWHTAAVYGTGYKFAGGSAPPSVDSLIGQFAAAGVPKAKLGLGLTFDGYAWTGGAGTSAGGATKPGQSWTAPPSVRGDYAYHQIADDYGLKEYDYSNPAYHWDDQAQAAYLSVDKPGAGADAFVSYDNEVSAKAKADYAKKSGLGGMIVWDLAGGWRAGQPAGKQDLLLQAVKTGAAGASGFAQNYGSVSGGPGAGAPPAPSGPAALDPNSSKAAQKFLTPGRADGVNDAADFGPQAQQVDVFDQRGQRVFHAVKLGAPIVWDCKDGSGRVVESGVYIAKIKRADSKTEYQSFSVVK